ncbi:hypothetical protein P8452_61087 [Trifolium repens]|nr:hypothetical protein P8452_61087 [Trifolium repens]
MDFQSKGLRIFHLSDAFSRFVRLERFRVLIIFNPSLHFINLWAIFERQACEKESYILTMFSLLQKQHLHASQGIVAI